MCWLCSEMKTKWKLNKKSTSSNEQKKNFLIMANSWNCLDPQIIWTVLSQKIICMHEKKNNKHYNHNALSVIFNETCIKEGKSKIIHTFGLTYI